MSNYFDVSSPPQNNSGECLTGCNFFQLEIEEKDGDTKLSLRRTSNEYRKKETKLCVNCYTTEFNEILKMLVENLVSGRIIEKNIVKESTLKNGAFEFLTWCKKNSILMGVCTNKQEHLSIDLLKKIKILSYSMSYPNLLPFK